MPPLRLDSRQIVYTRYIDRKRQNLKERVCQGDKKDDLGDDRKYQIGGRYQRDRQGDR